MLRPARFPEREMFSRDVVTGQEIRVLADWIRGISFHEYGSRPHELERYDPDVPQRLTVRGEASIGGFGGMSWSIIWQRAGDPESSGLVGGSGTVEYAAYRALALIEAAEREEWEERLVVGLA